jgi:hypothetical protein
MGELPILYRISNLFPYLRIEFSVYRSTYHMISIYFTDYIIFEFFDKLSCYEMLKKTLYFGIKRRNNVLHQHPTCIYTE